MYFKILSIFYEICKGNICCMNISNKIYILKNIVSEGFRFIIYFFFYRKWFLLDIVMVIFWLENNFEILEDLCLKVAVKNIDVYVDKLIDGYIFKEGIFL